MELKNRAIAALVCGIFAVITVFTGIYAIFGLIAGIFGIVLSIKVKKELEAIGEAVDADPALKDIKGMATAGLICSIVGTAIAGIGVICVACIAGTVGIAACSLAPLR